MLRLLVAPIVLILRAIVQGRLSRLSPLFESLIFVHLFPDLRFLRTFVCCVRRRLQTDFFPRFPGRCFFPPPPHLASKGLGKERASSPLVVVPPPPPPSPPPQLMREGAFSFRPLSALPNFPASPVANADYGLLFPLFMGGKGRKVVSDMRASVIYLVWVTADGIVIRYSPPLKGAGDQ